MARRNRRVLNCLQYRKECDGRDASCALGELWPRRTTLYGEQAGGTNVLAFEVGMTGQCQMQQSVGQGMLEE